MNKEDRKDLVERLCNISRGDHERGCMGREYVCSCDYDETSWKTAEEAADEITRLRRELEEARQAPEPWAELCKRTFAIQHNPNCPSQFLVRLPGQSGAIDMKPYRDAVGIVRHQTGDILGFGKTLDEAARAALLAGEEGK